LAVLALVVVTGSSWPPSLRSWPCAAAGLSRTQAGAPAA